MQLPIGVSDFKTLIDYKNPITGEGYLFVDKTLLIKEILSEYTEVEKLVADFDEDKSEFETVHSLGGNS